MELLCLIVWILLLVGIVGSVFLVYYVLKNYKNIPQTDKEFIIFTIDMYCQYAKELDIYSSEQHDIIVDKLNNIKLKHLVDKTKKPS